MPDYDTQPHVVAKIRVKIGSGGWHEFGSGASAAVKAEASAWLNAQRFTRPNTRIVVEISLTSPDVPWTHRTQSDWKGDAAHGVEYSAEWIETTPEWGGSRAKWWGGSREG